MFGTPIVHLASRAALAITLLASGAVGASVVAPHPAAPHGRGRSPHGRGRRRPTTRSRLARPRRKRTRPQRRGRRGRTILTPRTAPRRRTRPRPPVQRLTTAAPPRGPPRHITATGTTAADTVAGTATEPVQFGPGCRVVRAQRTCLGPYRDPHDGRGARPPVSRPAPPSEASCDPAPHRRHRAACPNRPR